MPLLAYFLRVFRKKTVLAFFVFLSVFLLVANIFYRSSYFTPDESYVLHLRKLNQQFDIIESIGVLHHLEDPMAGWTVLSEILKPGGLMLVGLYSKLGRNSVAEMQKDLKKRFLQRKFLKNTEVMMQTQLYLSMNIKKFYQGVW